MTYSTINESDLKWLFMKKSSVDGAGSGSDCEIRVTLLTSNFHLSSCG
jgi:hypothetical protein